jgi:hypothetical protein
VYILIAVIALVGLGLWNYRAGVATLDAHSQYLKLSALPAFVWVEVESAAPEEVDGDLEVLWVPEPPGGLLDALDDRVDDFQARIADLVS